MSSIIEGYNYDIFISYRQKDNKHDGWVTEFVDNLKGELESTFKEEISVYYDINPHDGLLETHDVDESLKEKLKCLVFIPIISWTYCDPKSFAWEHEFRAFVELASRDQIGLNVKLSNGNVASRVLPVRIHDLDADDEKLCKSVLGGTLRGIEFIYREPGVNRPLTFNDDEKTNISRSRYRNQINKVALAIKEIIIALQKNDRQEIYRSGIDFNEKPVKSRNLKSRILLTGGILILTIPVLIFFNSILYLFNVKNRFVRKESVIKIESVSKIKESEHAINQGMIDFLLRFNITNKCNLPLLDEEQFNILYPPGRKVTNLPWKNIEIKTINGGLIQPYDIEYKITDNQNQTEKPGKITFYNNSNLLNFNGELAKILTDLGTTISNKDFLTNDWSAFEYYFIGEKAWEVLDKINAKQSFRNSIQIDPTFTLPYLRLSRIYHFEENNQMAKHFGDIAMKSIGNLTRTDSIRAMALWFTLTGERKKAIDSYKKLIEYLPAQTEPYYELAEAHFRNGEIDEASKNYINALTIDPDYSLAHNHLAYCYSAKGRHDLALKHVKKYLEIDSTANAWDSYGDILIASGDLETARWAKSQGLKLDSLRDYFYQGLAYICVQEMKFREAEMNSDKYTSLQADPLRISRGYTNKAFIYYASRQLSKSLEMCQQAEAIFDSDDLLTRNHVLHWILSRIYLETNDMISLDSEMKEMQHIIKKNNIDQFNYNMIFKFYQDIKIHKYFRENKIDSARMLIELFDKDIYDKVKEWNYPFDIAFFNTGFGKLFLETDDLELCKERIDKALEYNNKYPFAHLALACYYAKKNQAAESLYFWNEFSRATRDADPEAKDLVRSEFRKFTNSRN